jgi:hypothetical protein
LTNASKARKRERKEGGREREKERERERLMKTNTIIECHPDPKFFFLSIPKYNQPSVTFKYVKMDQKLLCKQFFIPQSRRLNK